MIQNGISKILDRNSVIPVVTINNLSEVEILAKKLSSQGISCIEITLRTPIAWEAISEFKKQYGDKFDVGVGTIVLPEHIEKCKEIGVDFMVSPGCAPALIGSFEKSGIPFIPGVSTPSEVISGINNGWSYFKFFPAKMYGGVATLKLFGQLFPDCHFCPTGGISQDDHNDYLALDNVLSVGGSWLTK